MLPPQYERHGAVLAAAVRALLLEKHTRSELLQWDHVPCQDSERKWQPCLIDNFKKPMQKWWVVQ